MTQPIDLTCAPTPSPGPGPAQAQARMRAATAATEVGNHQHGGEGVAKTGGVRSGAPWARLPLLACVAPGFSDSLGILMAGAGETVLAFK